MLGRFDPPSDPLVRQAHAARLRWALLTAWLLISFGSTFFARDLQLSVAGWPLNFWLAAQGAILLFIVLVTLYAWLRNRLGDDEPESDDER